MKPGRREEGGEREGGRGGGTREKAALPQLFAVRLQGVDCQGEMGSAPSEGEPTSVGGDAHDSQVISAV